jgi:hypothetical protein
VILSARAWGGSRPLRVFGFAAAALVASLTPRAAAADDEPEAPDATAEAEPPDYLVSKEGHPFRVRFDPASRIRLGAGVAFALDPEGGIDAELELEAGLGVRTVYRWGRGIDEIIWQVDHRFVSGWLWPLQRSAEGVPALDMTLYGAFLHRHDDAPSIVLPLSPPRSVPFPFDIGFEAEAGRFLVPAYSAGLVAGGARVPFFRATVLRMTAYLDPLRSPKPGRSIEIGVGARYDIEPYAMPSFDDPMVIHRVAPGTVGSLRFRFQTDDGLLSLRLGGEVIPHWTSETTWRLMALGNARIERTLIAINDQPISLALETDYRRNPESSIIEASHDVRVGLSLELGISLR